MIRKIIVLILLILEVCLLSALELAINEDGKGTYVQGTPSEFWLIITDGYQTKIFSENFEELVSFDLPHNDASIIAAGRDFDDDDNIEVLYNYYDSVNYQYFTYCWDVTDQEYQLNLSDGFWFGYSSYLYGERFVMVNKLVDGVYTECRVYRSGVQQTQSTSNSLNPNIINNMYKFPNPFADQVTVDFELARSIPVSVAVYNIKSQRVRSFTNSRSLDAGRHQLIWDGCNDQGKKLPSGEYFFSVTTPEETVYEKVIYLK